MLTVLTTVFNHFETKFPISELSQWNLLVAVPPSLYAFLQQNYIFRQTFFKTVLARTTRGYSCLSISLPYEFLFSFSHSSIACSSSMKTLLELYKDKFHFSRVQIGLLFVRVPCKPIINAYINDS